MIVKFLAMVVFWIALIPCLAAAYFFFVNWSAQRDARLFCEAIPRGSDISLAIAKAQQNGIKHHFLAADQASYWFVFHASVSDHATCRVLLTRDQKVISRQLTFTQE